ncbi:phosphoribosyl 1,2-cyclic phosphate phosphodiesterase [Azospirillaceae bacterium]
MRVTILGCGGSAGVPVIGQVWGACNPQNPRNTRTRSSVLVEKDGAALLVDTPPELRLQLLTVGVQRIDAVLYTHSHADHAHGIDDLREVCRMMGGGPLDVFADAPALADLQQRFGYCFKPLEPEAPLYRPVLTPHLIDGPFSVGAIDVVPFAQDHGYSTTLGFRFGAFAYSTDVWQLDRTAFSILEGVEVWVVDCVREDPHPVHSHLEQSLEWIARVKPRQAFLTHMNQTMDYDTLCRQLPCGVAPAYDGLVIDL